MEKLYERIIWHNNTTPALNETNLNLMSKALDDVDTRLADLGGDILDVVPQIESYLEQAEDLYEAMETLSKYPPYIGENGHWYVWNTTTMEYEDSGIDASLTIEIEDVHMIDYGLNPYVLNTGTDTDPVFHLYIPRAAVISSIVKTSTEGLVDTYTITTQDNKTFTFTVTNGTVGRGIVSITKTATAGLVDTYTVLYTDSNTSTFTVTNGANGDPGRGIVSITKTATQGLVDTYTILYSDNTTSTFTVTNGQNGQGSGDMMASTYDPNSTVANAGGIPDYIASLGYITGLAWNALASKPFDTIGSGLTVDSNKALNANVQSVAVDQTGTASASGVRYQRIGVNGSYTEINGTKYMEQTLTTSTTDPTVYTFSNAAITADSVIDVYADTWGITPSSVVTTAGQCVVTIPKQATASSLAIRIYIK